jgi:hypothetical protein
VVNIEIEDIHVAIRRLKSGKATGYDAIKNEFLKEAADKSSVFMHTL